LQLRRGYGAPKTDLGLKLGLAAYYSRFGLYTSYSYSFTNNFADGAGSLHTEIFRSGISYRIL
jgi:hypothetical protein